MTTNEMWVVYSSFISQTNKLLSKTQIWVKLKIEISSQTVMIFELSNVRKNENGLLFLILSWENNGVEQKYYWVVKRNCEIYGQSKRHMRHVKINKRVHLGLFWARWVIWQNVNLSFINVLSFLRYLDF